MIKVITETTNSVSSLDTTGRRDQFDNTDHMPHFDSKKRSHRMQTTRLQREGHIYTVTNVMCICVSYKQRTVPPHFTEKQAKSK
jgi:hypothetical protein